MMHDVGSILALAASKFGPKTALIHEGRAWSFLELDEAVNHLAASLQGIGIGQGDRVSLYSPNSVDWVISYYAVLRIGAVSTR